VIFQKFCADMLATRFSSSSMLLRSGKLAASRTVRLTETNLFLSSRPRPYDRWIISQDSQRGTIRFYFDKRRQVPFNGGAGLKAGTINLENPTTTRWRRLGLIFKYTRIPFLIVAIYGLGYQQGVIDTVRNPFKLQQGLFESICLEMGVTSGDQVDIISERRPPPKFTKLGWAYVSDLDGHGKIHDVRTQRVASIGREIIRGARMYVKDELKTAVEKAKVTILTNKSDLSSEEVTKLVFEDPEVDFWEQSRQRIEGSTIDGIKDWQYVLLDTDIPNAFVSEMLPQRFFVTTGLFKEFVSNDDELAMILGHEVSHLVKGHGSQSQLGEYMLRGLEIFVLSLDPTEGLLSLGVAAFLSSTRDSLLAAHSRAHETEADELGCKLTAMACFDTKRGSNAFLKMHQHDVKHGADSKDLMSSHPPSLERYEHLQEINALENFARYSHCSNLKTQLGRALTQVQQ
jgi:Zn-dependent protease with chaperone function